MMVHLENGVVTRRHRPQLPVAVQRHAGAVRALDGRLRQLHHQSEGSVNDLVVRWDRPKPFKVEVKICRLTKRPDAIPPYLAWRERTRREPNGGPLFGFYSRIMGPPPDGSSTPSS